LIEKYGPKNPATQSEIIAEKLKLEGSDYRLITEDDVDITDREFFEFMDECERGMNEYFNF